MIKSIKASSCHLFYGQLQAVAAHRGGDMHCDADLGKHRNRSSRLHQQSQWFRIRRCTDRLDGKGDVAWVRLDSTELCCIEVNGAQGNAAAECKGWQCPLQLDQLVQPVCIIKQ